MTDFHIIISNYKKRGDKYLNNLLENLRDLPIKLSVVINDDDANEENISISNNITYIERPNIGMNIGGWSASIKYSVETEFTIFLQDECFLKSDLFMETYYELLNKENVVMIGESINPKWSIQWENIYNSNLNYPIKLNDTFVSRLDYYFYLFNKWGISPGFSGEHLRSLIWGFRTDFLHDLGQFPTGTSKEECIASEISVSKLVQQKGLKFCQSDIKHFKYFGHKEWSDDGVSKLK